MTRNFFLSSRNRLGGPDIEVQVRGRSVDLRSLADQHGVDMDSPIRDRSIEPPGFRVYRLRLHADGGVEVYLLDSAEAREIAAWPHVVLGELDRRCLSVARGGVELISRVGVLEGQPLILHVLRAGPGYRVADAFRGAGLTLREAYVRPEYVVTSERDHTGQSVREVRVTFSEFSEVPEGAEVTLIKPDTEATGRTGIVSLERAMEEIEGRSSRVKNLVLYGFITEVGLRRIAEFALSRGVERIVAVALVDLAALASNDYDMVLYGPDLHAWGTRREPTLLGGVVGRETFADMVGMYVPGLDQPGDFSERQSALFDGVSWAPGNVRGHLRSAEEAIRTLLTFPGLEDWQREIAEEELARIREVEVRLSGQTV